MTPAVAQRIAIAEACGWRMVDVFEWQGDVRLPKQFHRSGACLPDYLNDLNAMHEAEKTLEEHDRACPLQEMNWVISYGQHLLRLTNRSNPYHATAAQRAEAFLRTLGLWVDK